jgi:hypothetical protein
MLFVEKTTATRKVRGAKRYGPRGGKWVGPGEKRGSWARERGSDGPELGLPGGKRKGRKMGSGRESPGTEVGFLLLLEKDKKEKWFLK